MLLTKINVDTVQVIPRFTGYKNALTRKKL